MPCEFCDLNVSPRGRDRERVFEGLLHSTALRGNQFTGQDEHNIGALMACSSEIVEEHSTLSLRTS